MTSLPWFERNLTFGLPVNMLPYYLERLAGTAVRFDAKIKDFSEADLSARLNDKWSVKQNIGHLAEVDEIANKRVDEIISGVTIMSRAVFEPKDYNPWPIEKVLELFKVNRLQNLSKYQALSASDLKKSSLHPRLKIQMTPIDLAWFDAEHDDHHLVAINEILKTFYK